MREPLRIVDARIGLQTFKTKPFARFGDRKGRENAAPGETVQRARSGPIDDDLGGGVIKQRPTARDVSSRWARMCLCRVNVRVLRLAIWNRCQSLGRMLSAGDSLLLL